MRPTVVVGVVALAFATVLAGTVATAEGVEPPTYRSLQEARFRPVILPTHTGTDVPQALVDARADGPLAASSNTPRLVPDAFVAEPLSPSATLATTSPAPAPSPTATPAAKPAPVRTTTTAGAVQGI